MPTPHHGAEPLHIALSPRAPAFVHAPSFAGPLAVALPSASELLRGRIADARRMLGR